MTAVPEFPRFVPIDISTKEIIEKYTTKYATFSDFNFTNLFSWNISEEMSLAVLNDNLVIKFCDYISGEVFLSFLGDNSPVDTARRIISYSINRGLPPALRLVPEVCVNALQQDPNFIVEEDIDNHDYIISLADIAQLSGSKQKHTRRLVKKFEQSYGEAASFREIDICSKLNQRQLVEVFQARETRKTLNYSEHELNALKRLMNYSGKLGLRCYGVSIHNKLRAFIILETGRAGRVTGHFWKADTSYRGLYHYLLHKLSIALLAEGRQLMNIEQDLGISGLRQAKMLLRPVGFLKKFSVYPNLQPQIETDETTDRLWGIGNLLSIGQND